jgi:hypothetical protein
MNYRDSALEIWKYLPPAMYQFAQRVETIPRSIGECTIEPSVDATLRQCDACKPCHISQEQGSASIQAHETHIRLHEPDPSDDIVGAEQYKPCHLLHLGILPVFINATVYVDGVLAARLYIP